MTFSFFRISNFEKAFVDIGWFYRFAILDGPTMPIIGEGDEEANDRYVCADLTLFSGKRECKLSAVVLLFLPKMSRSRISFSHSTRFFL